MFDLLPFEQWDDEMDWSAFDAAVNEKIQADLDENLMPWWLEEDGDDVP